MNPKESEGAKKPPLALIPQSALVPVSLVMQSGAAKYTPYNWRETEINASTYVSAIQRHLAAWNDGEDADGETGLSHIAHMVACGLILLDAGHCGMLNDDRPPWAPTADLIRGATRGEQ